MEKTQVLSGQCPHCKEQLEIPSHLKQFSCMYCGARLSPRELITAEAPRPSDGIDGQACAAYYKAHILETITEHLGIEKEVTASGYAPSFDRYTAANEETFRQLDAAVSVHAITMEEAVGCYLNQLEDRWAGCATKLKSKASFQEADKFVIAIYLVPMVRKLELVSSEAFCQALHAEWMKRYPKAPFFLGTYEELSSGFHKKFLGLCYITTAICLQDGKSDDCEELTAFRAFRDGYLRSCPDGPALIQEYYDVAPGIVLHLELASDKEQRYAAIREQYLLPCYADIQSGKLKQCKERYTAMVRNLKQEYLS